VPDYSEFISLIGKVLRHEMISLGLCAFAVPLIGGFLFGPRYLMGMSAGAVASDCLISLFGGDKNALGQAKFVFTKLMPMLVLSASPFLGLHSRLRVVGSTFLAFLLSALFIYYLKRTDAITLFERDTGITDMEAKEAEDTDKAKANKAKAAKRWLKAKGSVVVVARSNAELV